MKILILSNGYVTFVTSSRTKHVILDCSAYDLFIHNLFSKAISVLPSFMDLNSIEKMKLLFTNLDMTRTCAKTCF